MTTLRPWFRLFRLPNLLTVPGDPLAGFLLASGLTASASFTTLLYAMGSALGLYLFGLAVNDIVDCEIDRIERPERPLPSGAITIPQARMAAIAAALTGLNLALSAGRSALYVAALLAATILAYNVFLKNRVVLGPLSMGLCRGLSLLLGVAAAQPGWFTVHGFGVAALPALIACAGLTLYVAGLSAVAQQEMSDQPQGRKPWLPFAALLLTLPALVVASSALKQTAAFVPTLFVFLMIMVLMRAWLLGGALYRVLPRTAIVGAHIRNLLLLQAALCVAVGQQGIFPAVTLLLLSVLFPRLTALAASS